MQNIPNLIIRPRCHTIDAIRSEQYLLYCRLAEIDIFTTSKPLL